jgi:hypothetical protein
MRTIVIGDPHGCRDELKLLLDDVGYVKGSDRCVIVGDLVDRGPDSIGVIALCMELGLESIEGNHDEKHVRHARNLARNPDSRVGFRSEDERYMWSRMTDDQRTWMSSLPDWLRLGPRLVVVHAGMLPGISIENQPKRALQRLRYVEMRERKDGTSAWEQARMRITDDGGFLRPRGSVYWDEVYDGPDDVVYGHNVFLDGPRVGGKTDRGGCPPECHDYDGSRCIGVDTGACFGGHLTAAVFDEPDTDGVMNFAFVSVVSSFTDSHDMFYEGEYDL